MCQGRDRGRVIEVTDGRTAAPSRFKRVGTMSEQALLVGIVALAAVLGLGLIVIYNRLVKGRQLVREAWSGIDVQLKRRADLIPNLVEVVRGYAQHERGLLEELTRLRSATLQAASVAEHRDVAEKMQTALQQLFVVAEAYPNLKADQSYLSLQDELVKLEDQIQMARRYYNGTVRDQNIRVESFPSNAVAGWFGFRLAEYFGIDAADRQVPKVQVGSAGG
jgi:LemA protein